MTAPAFSEELTVPPPSNGPDTRPKRPTTRAGRRAAAEAKRAERLAKRTDKPPSTKKPSPRRPSLEARLQGLIATVGLGLAAVGPVLNPAYGQDGKAVIAHSPNVAKALSKWADENPAVRQALEFLLTGGAIGGVLFALLPLAAEIGANHGAVPSGVPAMFAMFGAPAGTVEDEDQAPAAADPHVTTVYPVTDPRAENTATP